MILLIHWARDEETEIKQGKTLGRKREENGDRNDRSKALQFEGLIPDGVEAALYGLGLLFTLTAGIRDQFKLHVGV